MSFIDRNSNTHLRTRRNAQRLRDGLSTGSIVVTAPLSNSGTQISLTLASASGLEVSSSALRIDLNTSILSLAAAGLGFATQVANTILAGPTSGGDAVPTFRALVVADFANDLITYAKIQNVSATDRLLGRSTSGAGDIEEITCTAAGRAILDDADAAAQRTTLGFADDVYTPTLFNDANLDASAAFECQYMRVGNTVTVSGKVTVDPTTTLTLTQLGISLPIASNFGAEEDCGGTAFASGIAGQGAAILADAANNRATMQWIAADVTNQPMFFSFTYRVI